jgi:tetratricopeptide (TPR) repeat protein
VLKRRPGAKEWSSRVKTLLVALSLAAVAGATFAPALGGDFLVYDDDLYVTGNAKVRAGLTWSGLRWAFTTGHAANWHPLTWVSHMTDVSLWGLNPLGHHLTNVLLHAVSAALVFLLLRSLTGAFWRSALVAALFAVHPTRVESVAWVAERKDVLSTLLGLMTLLGYAAWARRPTRGRYAIALAAFAAGLLAKPMMVTLPFVMVLLDIWPLRRLREGGPRTPGEEPRSFHGLIGEKWPFFFLSAASSVLTLLVQRAGGAVGSLESYPLDARLANAAVAYAGYLRRFVWPADLAVFYPHPGRSLPGWSILGAALLFLGLCVLALGAGRRRPYLSLGWLWFAGMLVPVIGLVQVGFQALADRYTYLSYVGLFIALVWLAEERLGRANRAFAAGLAVALVTGCVVQTRVELRHWRDSETLFRRALAVTRDNSVAHQNLAHHLNETGRPTEAIPHLEEALRIRPRYPEARVNLGRSLFLLGRVEEAVAEFERAISLRPDDPVAFNNLAFCRMGQGELAEAVRLYARALALQPDWAEVQHRAGIVQIMEGDWEGGGERLRRAAAGDPGHPEYVEHARGFEALRRDPGGSSAEAQRLRDYLVVSHRQAARVLGRQACLTAALAQLRKALRLDSARADLQDELGVVLTRLGRMDEAMDAFEAALRLDPALPTAHNNLGFLLFQRGRREAAMAHYREALRLAPQFDLARNNLALAEKPAGWTAAASRARDPIRRHRSVSCNRESRHGTALRQPG